MPISKIPGKGTQDLFTNVSDTGTAGTKVAAGTTAQRGSTTGQFRYNTTTNKFEGRNGAGSFVSIEVTPNPSSVSPTEVDSTAGGNVTFTITGTNFSSGDTAKFIGSDGTVVTASTTTIDSDTQITAVVARSSFANAKEPYDVRVTSAGGLSGNLNDQINVDSAPTWNTAAGSLGNVYDNVSANHFTLSATDAEGDTIAYSETGATNITGAGLSLNSSTGVISGDANDVGSDTTVSFTGRATAGGKTTDRAFSFVVKPAIGTSSNAATGPKQLYDAGYTTDGVYYINNAYTGGSARQCYCRFNTRDGVHWQRFTPYHLSGYHSSSHGGGAGNTSLTFITSDSQLQNTTVSSSNRDFTYTGSNSGAGVSYMIRTGKQMPDVEGKYLGVEIETTSTGDGGNRPRIGLDWQSSEGTGNWGHDYSQEKNWLQGGRDSSYSNGVRNFAAVKFAANGANTDITSYNSTVGGQYGTNGSTANLWTAYQDSSDNGYYPTNSGEGQNSYTVDDAYWWAIRIGGWSDNSTAITFHGIFYMGEK